MKPNMKKLEMHFIDLPIRISDEMGEWMIADGEKLFKSKHGGYVADEDAEKKLDDFYGDPKTQ